MAKAAWSNTSGRWPTAAVIDTTDNDARAFDDYLHAAARMPEYAAKFAEVLVQSHQPESPFTQQDAAALVKSAVSAGLTIACHPGGPAGLTPDQLSKSATAAGHLSAAATRAVTGKKPGDLPPGKETDEGHPSNVVSQLTRRYLIHAERTYPNDDPRHDDVAKIFSLALVSGDRRPCWGG